jgi:hypothetical protein
MTDEAPPPAKEPKPAPTIVPPASTMRGTTAEHKGNWARQLWIGFWWWILLPFDAMDLKTGLPDYQRLVPIWIGTIFTVKLLREAGWPPVVVVVVFVAGMISPGMFNRFLARSNFTAAALDTTSKVTHDVRVVQEILDRRTQGGDFELTP